MPWLNLARDSQQEAPTGSIAGEWMHYCGMEPGSKNRMRAGTTVVLLPVTEEPQETAKEDCFGIFPPPPTNMIEHIGHHNSQHPGSTRHEDFIQPSITLCH